MGYCSVRLGLVNCRIRNAFPNWEKFFLTSYTHTSVLASTGFCFKPLWRWLDGSLTIHHIQHKTGCYVPTHSVISWQTTRSVSVNWMLWMHRLFPCERPRASYKLYQIIKQLWISTSRCLWEPWGVTVYRFTNPFSLDERKLANFTI